MRTLLPPRFLARLRATMRVPVAPFCEHLLLDAIRARFDDAREVRALQDAYGNLLLRYRPGRAGRARLCFQAHLDHPGFRVSEAGSGRAARAEVFGQVPPRCRGARVLLFERGGGSGVRARITGVRKDGGRVREVRLRADAPLAPGMFGLFDFPPLQRRGGLLLSRGHDDTLGTAVLVELLARALEEKWPRGFDLLFTRAEEAGMAGACVLLARKTLPLPRVVLTVEMPRARGEVVCGGGVICRQGDGVTAFDPRVLAAIDREAAALAAAHPGFRWQRRLAWAGRTEASVFLLHGHATAALCLAVRHGHNIDPAGRPTPEEVHLGDLGSLWLLLVRLARAGLDADGQWRALRRSLHARDPRWRTLLRGRGERRP